MSSFSEKNPDSSSYYMLNHVSHLELAFESQCLEACVFSHSDSRGLSPGDSLPGGMLGGTKKWINLSVSSLRESIDCGGEGLPKVPVS